MAGRFQEGIEPLLPGSYWLYESEGPSIPSVSVGSITCIPAVGNWGPDREAVLCNTYPEFLAVYGEADTELRRAVFNAFTGDSRGGAGAVLVYRISGSSRARATRTLLNTTPAVAITFTARYYGTRGNAYRFTVRPAATAGNKELVILDGAREVEIFEFLQTDIAALAADVTARSGLFTAVSNVTGVTLADVSSQAAASGDDGATLIAQDYSDFLTAIEYEPFGVLAPYGVVDSTVLTLFRTYQATQRNLGKRFYMPIGAAAGEAFGTHRTRATGYNDEDIMALGTGSIADSNLSADGSEITISTAQGVARVAGAIARRGDRADMVMVRFPGWRIISGATRTQAEIAAVNGMTVLTRDAHRSAPTRIQLGVTTYVGNTDAKPARIWSNVKFMRALHIFETELTALQEEGDLMGEEGVTDRTRDLILGQAMGVTKDRIENEVFQPDSTVKFDTRHAVADTDDFVALEYDVDLVPGLRKVKNRVRVG